MSFRWVIGAITLFTVVLLIAPTAIVLITSFTDGFSLKFPPEKYSGRWYLELLKSDQIIDTALTSLKTAVVATALSVVLGTLAALAIARSTGPLARTLDALFMSPMVLPSLALGLALLMMFSVSGVRLSLWTLSLGHTIICIPFVIRMVSASVQEMNPALLDSSASLGAGAIFTFFNVTLPLIKRGVLAGAFVAFMASFDNVPVSLFLADARNEVLPIHLWQIIEASLDVRAAAVSGALVLLTLILMVVMERIAGISKQVSRTGK
ncbi:MAG: ABC transporter permease [Rubrivivax sp.]